MADLTGMLQAAAGGEEPANPNAWDISKAVYDAGPNAWDISKDFYTGFAFDIGSGNLMGLFFKPDGTKMYIVDNINNRVGEYNLSTPWYPTTGSFVQNFSIGAEETGASDLFFKPDGTKMYVIGVVGDDVNEYSLSSAWDISTASFVQSFSVATEESVPEGLFFKPDGTKMYVVGSNGDDVNEYDLSTPWDVSTASYLQNFSVSAQETSPRKISFKPDGTKMYVLGGTGDDINEYDLSTPWDVSSASFVQTSFVGTFEGLFFKEDGSQFYVGVSDVVRQYVIGAFSVKAQERGANELFFKPDGTKMYIVGTAGDDVNEYDLSTPWDITTASYLQNFSVSAQDTLPQSLFFKPDGTKMYVLGGAGDDVNEYDLSTAWDISTTSFVQRFSVSAQETEPRGLFFKPDGAKMYIVGTVGDDVNEYDLSTPWDVSSASYLQNFSISAQDTDPRALSFKPDGTKMYVLGNNGKDINEYDLSTAWDVSSASFAQNAAVAEKSPRGLYWRENGEEFFVVGQENDTVTRYKILSE